MAETGRVLRIVIALGLCWLLSLTLPDYISHNTAAAMPQKISALPAPAKAIPVTAKPVDFRVDIRAFLTKLTEQKRQAFKVPKGWYSNPDISAMYYEAQVQQLKPNLLKVKGQLEAVAKATGGGVTASHIAAIYCSETAAGNLNRKAKSSSALGATQFTVAAHLDFIDRVDEPLLRVIQKYDAAAASTLRHAAEKGVPDSGSSRAIILGTRKSNIVSFAAAADNLITAYSSKSYGVRFKPEHARLIHVYGASGAADVLKLMDKNPNAPITDALNKRALANNKVPTGANVPTVKAFYKKMTIEHMQLVKLIDDEIYNPLFVASISFADIM